MHAGYFKVHRKIVDSEVFQDPWLLKLFIWCLAKAKWDKNETKSSTERGQFLTTRTLASDQLRVTHSKWYRGMQRLQELGAITTESNSLVTMVTVCNYETYQDCFSESEQQTNSKRTANEQPPNSERTTYLIEEEYKKERKWSQTTVEVTIPAAIDTPAFSRSWSDWLDYRHKSRQTMRPETLNRQLAMLAGLGEVAAIECVEASLRNGWKGLFPPKDQKPSTTKINLTAAVMDGAEWVKERDADDAR